MASTRSFGKRRLVNVRVPESDVAFFDELAAKEDLDLGPWVLKQLYERQHLPVPDYVGAVKRRQVREDPPGAVA